jgi:hypothetical protein
MEAWPYVATLVGITLFVSGYWGTFRLVQRILPPDFWWGFTPIKPWDYFLPRMIWLAFWCLIFLLWCVLTCTPFPWFVQGIALYILALPVVVGVLCALILSLP